MASFEDIRVGDEVVIDPPHFNRPRYVAKVERVTQTQFVASGYRFNKIAADRLAVIHGITQAPITPLSVYWLP